MEGKRPSSGIKSSNQLVKSRSVSSLRLKGESPRDSGKPIPLNKNTPAGLRSSSNALHTSAVKSAGKDMRSKTHTDPNEKINGEPLMDEAKLDVIDDAYNSYISSIAMKTLLDRSKLRVRRDIDRQMASLQKRVNDNLDALEETRSKLSTIYLLKEQYDLLQLNNDACLTFSNELAINRGKNFEELLVEMNRIKNQLPCKNVSIPEHGRELANFKDATYKLLHSLESISTAYGPDQTPIMRTAAEIDTIKLTREEVESNQLSTNAISQKASTSILSNAILKTPKLNIS